MWNKLLTSVDLMGAEVPSSSVGENGEFHDGLLMAADIHNYYSSKDPILNILEFADNLPPDNPALGHTDAPTQSIYNINVTDIVGEDHYIYIYIYIYITNFYGTSNTTLGSPCVIRTTWSCKL
jgi:hypothetical protein